MILKDITEKHKKLHPKKSYRMLILFISILIIIASSHKKLFSIEKPVILGALQVLYDYNFSNNKNSFNSYSTAFGVDGNLSKRVGYRILISLNPESYKFEGFDFYGRFFTPIGEIRIGQFKVPFSMERLIPFPKRDFVENAIATNIVNGRDIGIGLYGEKKWIEYNVGIFNGEGMNKKDANKAKDIVCRIAFKKSFGENLSFLIGGALYSGKSGEDEQLWKKNLLNLQFKGRLNQLTLSSEYVNFKDTGNKGNAFYATLGYEFPIKRYKLEPLLRYESYASDNLLPDDTIKKITFGINFYLKGHNIRFQFNVSSFTLENQENYAKLFTLAQFLF
jgi:hypothetical protein